MSTPDGARQQDHWAEWRLADKAFEEADSQAGRVTAMVRQFRAREAVERWSWAERRLPEDLRKSALEEGLWSVEEAVERLGRIDFVERHRFIGANLALFPDASLSALLDLLRGPQPGDGAIWYPGASALTTVALRLARAGRHEAALDAIRALRAGRTEALRRCAPFLPRPLLEAMIAEIGAWAPGEPEDELDPEDEALARDRRSARPARPTPVEPVEARLGKLLFGPQGAERLSTDKGFANVVDFAEHHATGEPVALLVEYARSLEGERRAALSRALLDGGEPLWGVPGFEELFSPEQRQAHLRAAVAAYERPAEVPIHDTLKIAATLVEGEPRRAILPLLLDEVRKLRGRWRLEGLCSAAALAGGELRAAVVDEALAWMKACEELDEDDRAEAAAALSKLPMERAAPVAERPLDPGIEGSVRALLAMPDTEDDGLREALAMLPESACREIWSARGRASAWRRTIDLTDPALFAYIASEHYLHAEAVIRLVLGVGGASAVVEFIRMLVALP